MSPVETALNAAFNGPEVKKLKVHDHEFNIKRMEITVAGGAIKAHGQISHHLSLVPDDQVYYDITVVDRKVTQLQRRIEDGGFSKIFAAVAPFIDAFAKTEIFNSKQLRDALTSAEGMLNGSWEGVVDYLLSLFATQIAAGYDVGQMSQALTAHGQSAGGFAVYGEIRKKYDALGGPGGFLGQPQTDETGTPDGVGRYNHFQGGSIYWTPRTGAHEVHGDIRGKWSSLGWERSFLGYPLTDESVTPDHVGRYNHFQGGSIYWTPGTGVWEVHGAIRDKYASLGWERSALGYPVSDERDLPGGGRYNQFQHGRISWKPDRGAWVG